MRDFEILPPAPHLCQECAEAHDPLHPHVATSFFYQMKFQRDHGRPPTWADAMSHCSDELRRAWAESLAEIGIDASSSDLTGGIESEEDLDERIQLADEGASQT